eukprot:COSAG06_NODE_159_length_21747_cov_5.504111_7_plen_164_part_00
MAPRASPRRRGGARARLSPEHSSRCCSCCRRCARVADAPELHRRSRRARGSGTDEASAGKAPETEREGERERAGTEAHRLGREPALVHMSNRPCQWVAVYLWTSTSMVRPLVDRPPSPWVERNPQQKTGVARARLTLPTHMTAKARGGNCIWVRRDVVCRTAV